jgi:hypothetical protein
LTHRVQKREYTSAPQFLRNGINLVGQGAGKSGAVWGGFRPFQIVSLLEMIEFQAREFLHLLNALVAVKNDLEQRDVAVLSESEQQGMLRWADEAKRVCGKYGMDVSYYTGRIENKAQRPDEFKPSMASVVNELRHCILKELRDRKFMFIPIEESKYYDQEALFGQEIQSRFPQANAEISAAGNCYATGNYTACVFHLMRAVEIGARCMVTRLGVHAHLNGQPLELCDWGTLIAALQKGVDTLATGTRTDMRKKKRFEFYNHAVGSFRNFKDAWRNHVSHTREMYQPGKTKDIMDNTRQFMTHLAEQLREPKRSH